MKLIGILRMRLKSKSNRYLKKKRAMILGIINFFMKKTIKISISKKIVKYRIEVKVGVVNIMILMKTI